MTFVKKQTLVVTSYQEEVTYERLSWFKKRKWYCISMSFLSRTDVADVISINNIIFRVIAKHQHADGCWHISVKQINPTSRSRSKHTFQYTDIVNVEPALA